MTEGSYKQMATSIIPKSLKSKILLILTILFEEKLTSDEEVIIKFQSVRTNHQTNTKFLADTKRTTA